MENPRYKDYCAIVYKSAQRISFQTRRYLLNPVFGKLINFANQLNLFLYSKELIRAKSKFSKLKDNSKETTLSCCVKIVLLTKNLF